ncbi:MAG: HlyD family efflux transporter periplasmic adaptor subunit [Deltaproteobacteria bacterium]|nr:MAG: HlyD family efflux transporter periplasmic adaptor subunit [Deltaproteobacteria bacterium]
MIKNLWVAACAAAVAGATGCQPEPRFPGALQGVVEYDEVDLAFDVGGRLADLAIDEGDAVAPGEPVAALDDAVQRAVVAARRKEADAAAAQLALLEAGARDEDIRAARAELDAAVAAEKQLAALLARHRALAGTVGASPQSVVDEVQARYDAAVARRRAAEQQLRALRAGARSQELRAAAARADAARALADAEAERLARYRLASPVAGDVVAVAVHRGEVIGAGAPIATVADVTHPFADVFVPQAQLDGVRVGAAAEVHVDARDTPLEGRVEYVERRTEFTPRYVFSETERPHLVVRVRVRIDDPDRVLHAGVPAFVYLR